MNLLSMHGPGVQPPIAEMNGGGDGEREGELKRDGGRKEGKIESNY